MIVAGIMSGTSLDGIDVAIVKITRSIHTLARSSTPYPPKLREAILAVSNTTCHTAEISRLNFLLPRLYANALKPLLQKHKVDLIGCHGQTIYHGPRDQPPNTLQLGDGSVLAELTGIPVVSGFRPRDMAAGGQGAPLVPFVDYRLFRHRTRGRVALNIGGIANLTAIPPGAAPEQVIAFDTGPGNMVIDGLMKHFTGRPMDRDGAVAARGRVHHDLLTQLLRDPFYRSRPPKSAGREQYGIEFVERLLAAKAPFEDIVATATALTTSTIALAIQRFVAPRMPVHDLIVSGGGAHNPRIMRTLAARPSNDYGIDVDAKEAIAFAILAHETWRQRSSNLPSATGARHPVILGNISW